MHPTEDELIEVLSGEADTGVREALELHVRNCAECRQVWDELNAALTMVGESVPEPPSGFERIVWARVRDAVAEPTSVMSGWRQWLPAGVLAASVLAGAWIAGTGRAQDAARRDPAVGAEVRAESPFNERVLYAALDDHLRQAEALLVELRNAPDRAGLAVERVIADDLVAAGRLYRATAEYTGHHGLVSMLDELEPVLVEVARAPVQIDSGRREWLRERIEEDALLFKVRAVTNDIRDRVVNPVD
jgi:hypothetical protein